MGWGGEGSAMLPASVKPIRKGVIDVADEGMMRILGISIHLRWRFGPRPSLDTVILRPAVLKTITTFCLVHRERAFHAVWCGNRRCDRKRAHLCGRRRRFEW